MAFRKPVDEWGMIIQKQSELNKQRDLEERLNKQHEKNDYRKDLLFQQQLRDYQKKDELNLKQTEAQEIEQRVAYFREQEEFKRQQEMMLKKQIGDDYTMQQNYIKQKEMEEKQKKYEEEQKHLARIKAELEADERRRKEARDKWNMEQQMMLNYKREQENMKKEMEMNEKQYELELIRQRKLREEQREQNYRDYYQKLSDYQINNVQRFNNFLNKDQKEQERAMWIEKNIAEQNAILAQKEEYEKYLRQMNIRNTNLTLRQQMEEKERLRLMAIEEEKRQIEEHRLRIEESIRLQQEKELQKRMQKAQYNEDLSLQKTLWTESQMMAYKLSEHEKKLNKNFIEEKGTLQRGGAQILKNNSLNPSSYEENAKKFFGNDSPSRTPNPNRPVFEPTLKNNSSFSSNKNNRPY